MIKKRYIPAAVFLSFLAAILNPACTSLPETHYYTMGRIVSEPGSFGVKIGLSVGVPQFEAEGIYARDNLLYRSSTYEIAADYYRRWGVPPQKMLAEETVSFLRSCGLFSEVLLLPSMARVDLILVGRILRFEEVSLPVGSEARVELGLSLCRAKDHMPLWRQEFSASSAVEEVHTAEDVIAAFEKCVRSCLEQAARSIAESSSNLIASAK